MGDIFYLVHDFETGTPVREATFIEVNRWFDDPDQHADDGHGGLLNLITVDGRYCYLSKRHVSGRVIS